MDLGLKGKHVYLTGSSGGIGIETAKLFLNEGAKVSLHYNKNNSSVKSLKTKFEDQCFLTKADVTKEKDVVESINSSVKQFGPIDILVVNHGIWIEKEVPIIDMELKQWNHTLNVDLTGSFLFVRETLRQAKKFGIDDLSIVLIGSTAGIFGEANHSDYASAKSALTYGFLRSLKNELPKISPNGRANLVAPGWVRTPMAENALKDTSLVQKVLQTIPMRKIATPIDVANAILFLSSPKVAGHINGAILEVTGGMEGRVLYSAEEVSNNANLLK